MDIIKSDYSLDVYKYRKHPDKTEIFKIPASDSEYMIQFDDNNGGQNSETPEMPPQRPRTYAILQEGRTEFTNSKLRYALIIYTNSGWNLLILTVLFVSYILETWLYTFCPPNTRPSWIIVLIICLNTIFMLDVTIFFGLKFFKKWRRTLNIVEPDTVLVILDVILAMPYGLLYLPDLRVFDFDLSIIAPFVAAIRVYRILEYFYDKSSQAGRNQWSTFLFQYLILFLLSVHTLTCVWYQFAYRGLDVKKLRSSWSAGAVYLPTETVYDWYLICAYWSVMFLTTNALGDLYPITTSERLTATVAIILGFLLTTIVFVGSLTSQFITITTRRSKYVRQLAEIKNHLKLINMNEDTTRRIIRYYEDLWYQKSGVFKPKLMKLLPYPLRMEICYDLNAVPLYSSLVFRKLPEPFLRRLSLAMAHQFYLPGDIVCNHNQTKTVMICITSGVLELLSDEDDESPMISFAKGTCIGEISLVYNIPARCTVKAATYVECQVLHKKDYIKLMITYPDLVERIKAEIQDRIDRCQKRKHTQCHETPLSLNIYATKNLKKSSIKFLKDKLRSIQGKGNKRELPSDDYLDLHCLDLYILSEHIKKRTTSFTCVDSKLPWILEADCDLVKFWELYMLCIVFYICIIYPYYIGFLRSFPGGFLYYIEIVINISLVFNIVMNCVTAIKTKKKYVRKFHNIISYRMNTLGFYLDLIANIPLEYLVSIHTQTLYLDNHRKHLFYMSKGIKLSLVWRLSNFFENLEKNLLLNTVVVKVAKYCVFISLLCYWCGVILYMESCFVSRCSEDSWYTKILNWELQQPVTSISKNEFPLITSIYFSTTLILSVGYGDFSPGDHYDMGLVAFLSLYGLLLVGYCVAEFSAVITHWSRTKTAFLEVILTIDKFMVENNMHPAIKSRIMAFYELQWQYNSGVELTGENWLEKTVVPSELRKKVLHQARFKALTSIGFFQVKNKAFIHTLTETARDIILPPGEIVYYGGTVSRELYIIESGYCLVTSKLLRDSKGERIIGPENHLGLLVLLYGVPAVSTVVTLTHCKLICIGHSSYTSALSLFPDMREHDNILTNEELKRIEAEAKLQNTQDYLKHYQHSDEKKIKITSLFQNIFNSSFINVYMDYKQKKQSYFKSYQQFKILEHIAPYILIPITIKPDGPFLKIWAILRVATAFLLCLLIPINVSMAPMCKIFNIPLLVMECICYIDLYLMLHVAFYGGKKQLITHPYLTAKNYLKGAFIVDFLTCAPWYAIWQAFIQKHNEGHTSEDHLISGHMYHCIVRMVNVLQIYKLYAAFWTESIGALKRAYLMSVVQFSLLMLFFLNLYTSLLITLSCRYVVANCMDDLNKKIKRLSLPGPYVKYKYHPNGNMICQLGSWIDVAKIVQEDHISPMKTVLLGYYWAASTFSGAGFGDITAQDTTHMILSICITLHGVLFFGYVYARIASLKAMADQTLTKFQENLKHLELFMNREHIPSLLKQNIIDHWKYQWKRTGGWSHQTILGKLHANLNEDAVLYMYEKTLREIPLFEDVEYSFFRAFAKKLSELYFQKGYMVMRSNEVISHIYIIYRGKVDIISQFNEVEACMGPGGIFGNIRGAAMYLTMSNVVASRNIDLLRIDGPEFYALLKSFPSVLRKVKQSVDNATKDYVLPTALTERRSSTQVNSYQVTSSSEDEYEGPDLSTFLESPEKSVAESHGSRSVTSIENSEYVPATLLLFKPHRWFRSSVIPDCKWIQFMEYVISFLSYIDFMILVYEMAFQSVPFFFYICIISDTVFLYKLFLDFHTGYMNRYGDYVLNPRKVRKVFFSRSLLRRRDFLANLPVSYLALTLDLRPEVQMIFFSYLRTPQLSRITYLFTHKTHRKINIGSSNLFFKLLIIGIWASILSHINACLFFKLSCLTPKQCISANWMSKSELNLRAQYSQKDFFSIYIAALWYMINLLTITGTGDVSSQNDFEVVETIIIIVVIKFCTGLLISEMSAMITAHSSSRIAYDYGINELRDGLRDMDLSEHQMNKMWDYVRELWNRQQGRQMPELVYELPFRLRCQIMQAVYGSHISNSVIFRRTDADFRRMLAMWIKHCVFFPSNYIVQCGDADQCIYFIHRGEVEVLTVHPNLTESIYDILGPEDCFGLAQGLFVGVSHHFSFRARTVVDIVYLRLNEWKYLLDFYPKSAKMVQKKVQNVYLAI